MSDSTYPDMDDMLTEVFDHLITCFPTLEICSTTHVAGYVELVGKESIQVIPENLETVWYARCICGWKTSIHGSHNLPQWEYNLQEGGESEDSG